MDISQTYNLPLICPLPQAALHMFVLCPYLPEVKLCHNLFLPRLPSTTRKKPNKENKHTLFASVTCNYVITPQVVLLRKTMCFLLSKATILTVMNEILAIAYSTPKNSGLQRSCDALKN